MIVADTSVWVDHFRRGDVALGALLEHAAVWMHPWIIGELALGGLKNRAAILALLSELPSTPVCEPAEILAFIETAGLAGRGVGLVDAHVLASARLCGCRLWTRNRTLASEAARLDLAWSPD